MPRSLCNSCGLRSRNCQCDQQLSTTGNANANGNDGDRAFKLTPATFCVCYLTTVFAFTGFFIILPLTLGSLINSPNVCYLEVFVDSLSVSNASTANANATVDWNVRFLAKNNGCKTSLHTIKSRLFRGDKVISESSTPDIFGLRVQAVSSVQVNDGSDITNGFLNLNCVDIPVSFTVDPAGHVKGSLLGYMRPCEYLFRKNYTGTSF
ncbi:uncharacterized protein LOC112086795 [Eutrema salsugineum]|uniref:uncharacterized protein LOC112086795 n=1 Tax=Eutrema salsugineum TaxID=72664 RepID=UPI000CED7DD4|nr:uncharacterized protein LOC112086795 [Eutrema salsugineum]